MNARFGFCEVCGGVYRSRPQEVGTQRRRFCSHRCRSKCKNMRAKFRLEYRDARAIWERQGRACGICRVPVEMLAKSTHVDHDHVSGRVRGILCYTCNVGLGHYERLLRYDVASYLEEVSLEARLGSAS